jgi:hypothetical protein
MDPKTVPPTSLPENGLIPTARAAVDVGRGCDAKCRVPHHASSDPRWVKPLEQVDRELEAARARGCNSVSFTGCEPTLHPDLPRIIARAEELGLHTCTLTLGLSLEAVKRAVAAGCREWLVSLHGYEGGHDEIVGVEGAWRKVNGAVDWLNGEGCFVRADCTMTRLDAADLPRLARHCVERVRARIVSFTPSAARGGPGREDGPADAGELQASAGQLAPPLREALRYLDAQGVWASVRRYPMCLLPGLESHVCNDPQAMFDPYEQDHGVTPKTTAAHLAQGRRLQQAASTGEAPCSGCGVRDVCGGADAGHVRRHGTAELTPYAEQSDHPYFFRSDLEADIVIPAYVPSESLARLLRELPRVTVPPYQLIVVGHQQSAARNRNRGLDRARSPYVIMCDDDIADLPFGWNRQLVYTMKENRELAAVSARLMRADGRPGENTAQNYELDRPLVTVDHIPTACCIFRRTEVRFDERYVRAGYEDTDYFLQLRQAHPGLLAISNLIRAVHLNEEKNGGGAGNEQNRRLFASKWAPRAPQVDVPTRRARAAAQLEAGQLAGALTDLRALVAEGQGDGPTYNQLGFACWSLGARDEALEAFASGLALAPADDDALANFLDAAYTLGRFDRAEAYLRACPVEGARGPHAFLLADCLRRQGRREDARAALEGLRALDPAYPGVEELGREIEALAASAG